jgi:hypothetical protein
LKTTRTMQAWTPLAHYRWTRLAIAASDDDAIVMALTAWGCGRLDNLRRSSMALASLALLAVVIFTGAPPLNKVARGAGFCSSQVLVTRACA